MNRLTTMCSTVALALCLSGAAIAADQTKPQDPQAKPATPQTQQGDTKKSDPMTEQKNEQEYLSALKKCENMHDAQKQKCIDQARQQFHRM